MILNRIEYYAMGRKMVRYTILPEELATKSLLALVKTAHSIQFESNVSCIEYKGVVLPLCCTVKYINRRRDNKFITTKQSTYTRIYNRDKQAYREIFEVDRYFLHDNGKINPVILNNILNNDQSLPAEAVNKVAIERLILSKGNGDPVPLESVFFEDELLELLPKIEVERDEKEDGKQHQALKLIGKEVKDFISNYDKHLVSLNQLTLEF